MFNFFHKNNESGFELDKESLPSMNDQPSNSFDQGKSNNELSMDSFETNMPTPSHVDNPMNSSFSTSTEFTSPSPIEGRQFGDINHDIVRTKIDSLDSKVALMEAKMSNVEQKLDVIYQLILSEVSDETKRKIKVGKMMDTIKNS